MEVKKVHNVLTLSHDNVIVLSEEKEKSPNELIAECGLVFTRPFFLLVNGEPFGRALWNCPLPLDAVCHFVELPRGGGGGGRTNPIQIVAMIALTAVAIGTGQWAAAAYFGKSVLAASIITSAIAIGGGILLNSFFASSAPVPMDKSIPSVEAGYSLAGGGNAIRLKQPFAEQFGRLKIYPDLEIIPCVTYETYNTWRYRNPQLLYFRGIIGIGNYSVEGIFLDDTPIQDFEDVKYRIISPGIPPTLARFHSSSAGFFTGSFSFYDGSTAYYPLSPSKTFDEAVLDRGWVKWEEAWPNAALSGMEITPEKLSLVINPAGTSAELFAVDLFCPVLFSPSLGGGPITYAYITCKIQVRKVNDKGEALSDWSMVLNDYREDAALGPVRKTAIFEPPFGPGRYEMEIWRTEYAGGAWTTSNWATAAQNNALYVGEIRAFRIRDWGVEENNDDWVINNTTRVEIWIKASSQLTGALANRINVVCTRKLYPVESSGFGATLTATRSIVDHCAYLVTSENAGQQDDSVLDFESLYALKLSLASSGYYFDWRFQGRTSIIEACSMIARCGKCIPYLPGGKFTLIQDEVKSVPSLSFHADDYTKDSFELEHIIRKEEDSTGIEVHYIDSDIWKEKTVECFDSDGSNERLAIVDLAGCCSRQQAYEIGRYLYLEDKLCRTLIGFETGLKGHIPLPGQRVLVTAPSIDWDQSGRIQKIEGGNVHLSDPVSFDETGEGVLYITGESGNLLGPYVVAVDFDSSGATEYSTVLINVSLPSGTKTVETDGIEAAKFLFGRTASDILNMKITKIVPKGQNAIGIYGSNYDASIHTAGSVPVVTDLPITSITLSYLNADNGSGVYNYFFTWLGSATKILLEIDEGEPDSSSGDGFTTLVENLDLHYHYFSTSAFSITVRATPYPDLDPEDAVEESFTAPATVTGLALTDFDEGIWYFEWDDMTSPDSSSALVEGDLRYRVSLWAEGEEITTTITDDTSFTIDIDTIRIFGGPWEEFIIRVSLITGDNLIGMWDELTIDYSTMIAPENLKDAYLSTGTVLSWDSILNATGYVVYQSENPQAPDYYSSSLDSSELAFYTLVYSGTHNQATITTDFPDGKRYFHVAGTNEFNLTIEDLVFSTIHVGDYIITITGEVVYDDLDDPVEAITYDWM